MPKPASGLSPARNPCRIGQANDFEGPELARDAANHTALSPVSILKRVERVHPELPAQIHGRIRRNWGEVAARCKRLASALAKRGIGKGDTVALIAPNIPEALECALALPMLGAVLNANNTRLDAGHHRLYPGARRSKGAAGRY